MTQRSRFCVLFVFAACSGSDGDSDGDSGLGAGPDAQTSALNPCAAGCTVTTLAGTGDADFADGPGNRAEFHRPGGISIVNDTVLFVADQGNNRIRRVDMSQMPALVSTVAGSGEDGFRDASLELAHFNDPRSVATVSDRLAYVADSFNDRVRRVDLDANPVGGVTTVAGSDRGHVDGLLTQARFSVPSGIAIGPDGKLYTADQESNVIRVIDVEGDNVITIGEPGLGGYVDGPADFAKFNNPTGVAVDSAGTLYVADGGNHRIRRVFKNANDDMEVETFAGAGAIGLANLGGYVDGPAEIAEFAWPFDIAVDDAGRVYIADSRNHRIRVILDSPAGKIVETVAGSGMPGFDTGGWQDGASDEARFNLPRGVAVTGDGTKLFVGGYEGNRVRMIEQ